MNATSEIPGWGVDLSDDARPGVPMEHPPRPVQGAHWEQPAPQAATPAVLKVEGLARMPRVFGTAQPPRGLSGVIRRAAYGVPPHKVRHWLMLLAADRIDVAEHYAARLGPWMALLAPAVAAGAWVAMRRRR